MNKRLLISVVLGWLGLFLICLIILAPVVFTLLDGSVLPYKNILPLLVSIITIGVSTGLVLFIPCSALIVLTLEVCDHDTTDER